MDFKFIVSDLFKLFHLLEEAVIVESDPFPHVSSDERDWRPAVDQETLTALSVENSGNC